MRIRRFTFPYMKMHVILFHFVQMVIAVRRPIIFDCNQALSIHPDMVDETAFTLLDIASEMLSGEQLEDFRTALHAAVSG